MDKKFLTQLTSNLYQLTLLFPKKEPLRFKMRELADEILADLISIDSITGNPQIKLKEDRVRQILENLEILDNFFEVAKNQNWVSPSDILEIQAKYFRIKAEIKRLESDLSAGQVEIKRLESDLSSAQAEIKRLESDLSVAQAELKSLESAKNSEIDLLYAAYAQVSSLKMDLSAVQAEIKSLESDLSAVQAEIKSLESKVDWCRQMGYLSGYRPPKS